MSTEEETNNGGKPQKGHRTWLRFEDDLLRSLVEQYGAEGQWHRIAKELPGRTAAVCQHRWMHVLSPDIVKGGWTPEEDDKIRELVKLYGTRNWARVAEALVGRVGKQCRERWHNHLSPEVRKGPWTAEEEEILVRAHRELGNRWSQIAQMLPGRTDNTIKNYWNTSLKKRVDCSRAITSIHYTSRPPHPRLTRPAKLPQCPKPKCEPPPPKNGAEEDKENAVQPAKRPTKRPRKSKGGPTLVPLQSTTPNIPVPLILSTSFPLVQMAGSTPTATSTCDTFRAPTPQPGAGKSRRRKMAPSLVPHVECQPITVVQPLSNVRKAVETGGMEARGRDRAREGSSKKRKVEEEEWVELWDDGADGEENELVSICTAKLVVSPISSDMHVVRDWRADGPHGPRHDTTHQAVGISPRRVLQCIEPEDWKTPWVTSLADLSPSETQGAVDCTSNPEETLEERPTLLHGQPRPLQTPSKPAAPTVELGSTPSRGMYLDTLYSPSQFFSPSLTNTPRRKSCATPGFKAPRPFTLFGGPQPQPNQQPETRPAHGPDSQLERGEPIDMDQSYGTFVAPVDLLSGPFNDGMPLVDPDGHILVLNLEDSRDGFEPPQPIRISDYTGMANQSAGLAEEMDVACVDAMLAWDQTSQSDQLPPPPIFDLRCGEDFEDIAATPLDASYPDMEGVMPLEEAGGTTAFVGEDAVIQSEEGTEPPPRQAQSEPSDGEEGSGQHARHERKNDADDTDHLGAVKSEGDSRPTTPSIFDTSTPSAPALLGRSTPVPSTKVTPPAPVPSDLKLTPSTAKGGKMIANGNGTGPQLQRTGVPCTPVRKDEQPLGGIWIPDPPSTGPTLIGPLPRPSKKRRVASKTDETEAGHQQIYLGQLFSDPLAAQNTFSTATEPRAVHPQVNNGYVGSAPAFTLGQRLSLINKRLNDK